MGTKHPTIKHVKSAGINLIQINLQHAREATSNLMKVVAEEEMDIIFIQEPHIIQGKVTGIPTIYKTLTSGNDRCRAAVVVTNNQIHVLLIRQLSDADTVVVEIIKGDTKLIAASMHFDRDYQIEVNLLKIESILNYTKNTGVLIAADCNARSTLWHDKLTNSRGRILEEFTTSKRLFIMK